MNIFLIGYRCTGKTSVGKALARRLNCPFYDADAELVKAHGMHISEIVHSQGWDAFRQMERLVMKRLCALNDCVVATGGGVVLDIDNVKIMKQSGVLVWLKATPETIKKRIVQDAHTEKYRPALTFKGSVEEIEETLRQRQRHYQDAKDFSVDTDLVGIKDVCRDILAKLKQDKYVSDNYKIGI